MIFCGKIGNTCGISGYMRGFGGSERRILGEFSENSRKIRRKMPTSSDARPPKVRRRDLLLLLLFFRSLFCAFVLRVFALRVYASQIRHKNINKMSAVFDENFVPAQTRKQTRNSILRLTYRRIKRGIK
jgi:hypothetical protein